VLMMFPNFEALEVFYKLLGRAGALIEAHN
jgi:hypothetical protein